MQATIRHMANKQQIKGINREGMESPSQEPLNARGNGFGPYELYDPNLPSKPETKTTAKLVKINELATKAAEELGLTIVSARFSGQGKQKSLEICIYRPESAISFADCEAMSRNFEL